MNVQHHFLFQMLGISLNVLPSGSGSTQCLLRPIGIESISASRWACFTSRRSLARALCIIAAWERDPSGFWQKTKNRIFQVTDYVYFSEIKNFASNIPAVEWVYMCFDLPWQSWQGSYPCSVWCVPAGMEAPLPPAQFPSPHLTDKPQHRQSLNWLFRQLEETYCDGFQRK